jgi:DNA-binding response OmpR family regulator
MSAQNLILIIDDEPDLREMLQFKFEASGYRVVTAKDGVDGLEKLRTIQPQLIILDMNMPRMGGIEFYKNICGNDFKPKYPVLVLTARANIESLFKDFAIDGFMVKPFDIDQLAKEVEMIIKKRTQVEADVRPWVKAGAPRHVLIAEDDKVFFSQLAMLFLNAGYTVNSASSGTEAIERIASDLPNFALVKLDLKDIPGDIVVTRLRYMPRTSGVELVLYVRKQDVRAHPVMDRIGAKSHIFIEYNEPEDLLIAVDEAIAHKFKESKDLK